MSILLAIFGLAALYIVVHLYSNSTPNKTKDRRPPDKYCHSEGILDKERLEKTRREAREYLAKEKSLKHIQNYPLTLEKQTARTQTGGYGYSNDSKREEFMREEKRRKEYRDDVIASTSFFTSPNLYTPSSSPEHTINSDNSNHTVNHCEHSSSPDATCSFD